TGGARNCAASAPEPGALVAGLGLAADATASAARPGRGRAGARRLGRAPSQAVAAAVWGDLQGRARPRVERPVLVRRAARLPPPRGARGDPRRTIRFGIFWRAIRPAARGRVAARAAGACER